ncbi:hypothetical protein HEP87_60765 [Streptomyces sp. S1D4-11]|nr:hypothetical protein [Streptomyces sp. S1D4-11]
MNKNIRRSLVIAAGVTGAWALGSAVASADELPSSPLSLPDATVGATDTAATDTAATVTGKVGDTAAKTVPTVEDTARTAVTHQTKKTAPTVTHASAPQDEVDYLFGPLSAFAPQLDRSSVDETTSAALPPVAA